MQPTTAEMDRVEPDRVLLGARAAVALHRQNRGLATQRIAAMKEKPPAPSWTIEYGPDGMASAMRWGRPVWAPDA